MPRPPSVREVGFLLVSDAPPVVPRKGLSAHNTGDAGRLPCPAGYEFVENAFGCLITRAVVCPPVDTIIKALGPVAYLRKLASHRRRVRREEAALKAALATFPTRVAKYTRSAIPSWLRVCNCHACRKLLVARTQDRPDWRKRLGGSARRLDTATFVGDVPYCPECAAGEGVAS